MTKIERRDFLGLGLGLVAASALPGCRTGGPVGEKALFGQRGKYERLNLAYHRIRLGLDRPFSILHISDTHLTAVYESEDERVRRRSAMRTEGFGGHQETALAACLAWAKDNVDFVLHTGDLVDFPSEANFDLVRRYFGAETLVAPGNHEYGWPDNPSRLKMAQEAFRARCSAPVAAAYPHDLAFAAKTVNGVNFVAIDDAFATVTPFQTERFAAEVRKGLPIVLCLHVPIYTEDIWLATNRFWRGRGKRFASARIPEPSGDYRRQRTDPVTRDFIAYLRSEPLLKAVLAGHVHFAAQERFSPTAVQYTVGGNFFYHGQEILFT